MSQADQQVQNAAFPAVRTDINDNLAALFSQSSGASPPAVTVAFQPWIDISSSPAVWKVRNASNTGWITIGTIDATTFSTGGITAIANGGTGQTTATAALAALLPSQAGNSGKALTTDGSLASWGIVASGASVQVFTSSGTYTPTANKTTFLVFTTGGGAAGTSGGTSGGTGGGGGTAIRLYSATEMGASATVTVGAGGSTGGAAGGTSSFDPGGTGLTITGGGGSASSSGGSGGGSTDSLFSIDGSAGSPGSAGRVGNSFWMSGRGRGGTATSTAIGQGTAGVVLILEW
jgi:hypothetical protein